MHVLSVHIWLLMKLVIFHVYWLVYSGKWFSISGTILGKSYQMIFMYSCPCEVCFIILELKCHYIKCKCANMKEGAYCCKQVTFNWLMNSMGRHLNVDLLVGSRTHSVFNWLSLLNISLLKKPIDLKGLKFTRSSLR